MFILIPILQISPVSLSGNYEGPTFQKKIYQASIILSSKKIKESKKMMQNMPLFLVNTSDNMIYEIQYSFKYQKHKTALCG